MKDVKEILCKQLEYLAEASEKCCKNDSFNQLTIYAMAMVRVASELVEIEKVSLHQKDRSRFYERGGSKARPLQQQPGSSAEKHVGKE